MNDLFRGVGVQVLLNEREDFLKIKETLTRIGLASRKDKTLYQSCHILHKQGLYAIVHFKELFLLDGKPSTITEEDLGRRNTIANLLSEWKLVKLVDESSTLQPIAPLNLIKIVSYRDKGQWNLVSKYTIGGTKVT